MNGIRERAHRWGITRLCHFTPARNLAHIASDSRGLLASRHLQGDETSIFNPTDKARLDGYTDHVCCSIQYPNAWYFRRARGEREAVSGLGRPADRRAVPVAARHEVLSAKRARPSMGD